jgi:thioredoxin reductase (NADPH)
MPFNVDLLIIGTGPAGVSAAIQAKRDGLDFLLVGDEPVGGLVRAARRLDNLPGWINGIPGAEFADRLAVQLKMTGISPVQERVSRLEMDGAVFTFGSGTVSGKARAVILATGTVPAGVDIGLPGGAEIGIHRDVRTLPENLQGLAVAVCGGGEAALDTALNCLERGGNVVALARGTAFKAVRKLVGEAMRSGIDIRVNTAVSEVRSVEDGLELRLADVSTLKTDHAVFCTGRVPRRELLSGIRPSRAAQADVETGIPGLFTAGDLIRKSDRFTATAIGDGQRAARLAFEYLKGRNTDLFPRKPQLETVKGQGQG